MESSHTFTIGFEEDVFTMVENEGLYRARSIFKSRDVEVETDIPEDPDYLITEAEISDSYLSAAFSTIQPLDEHRSLLILNITCHPAPRRRFVNARVTWRISSSTVHSNSIPSPSPGSKSQLPVNPPKLAVIAPQHSVGGWTEEQTRLMWGLSLPVEVGFGGASIGIEPSREKETEKAVMHAMTIIGTIRDAGKRGFWTIEENKSSERGIPSHFQLAAVVDHYGPFATELDVKAELGGGLWPTYIQAKKGRNGTSLKRMIDVDTWKCGEIELEPGEVGWRKFLAGMTGEVSGVMLEFGQAIVRP